MKIRRTFTTAALVVASFTVTLAIVWMQGGPSAVQPAAPQGRAAPKSTFAGWSIPHFWAAPPAAPRSPATLRPTTQSGAEAVADEVPASNDAGPPLPVYFTVTAHPGIAATDSAIEDGPAASDRSAVLRQVDIVNNSDALLEITVVALNVPTQQTTQAHLLVRPHHQEHAGPAAGLKLEPGDQVALRSSGYREMTAVVP